MYADGGKMTKKHIHEHFNNKFFNPRNLVTIPINKSTVLSFENIQNFE